MKLFADSGNSCAVRELCEQLACCSKSHPIQCSVQVLVACGGLVIVIAPSAHHYGSKREAALQRRPYFKEGERISHQLLPESGEPPTAQPRPSLIASSLRSTRAWPTASAREQQTNTALSELVTSCALSMRVLLRAHFNLSNEELPERPIEGLSLCDGLFPPAPASEARIDRSAIVVERCDVERSHASSHTILRRVARAICSTTSFRMATKALSLA
eukprot:5489611-Prymnesium_polylepis.2